MLCASKWKVGGNKTKCEEFEQILYPHSLLHFSLVFLFVLKEHDSVNFFESEICSCDSINFLSQKYVGL